MHDFLPCSVGLTILFQSQDKPKRVLSQMAGDPLDTLRMQNKQPAAMTGSAVTNRQDRIPGAKTGLRQAQAADSQGVHMSASEVIFHQ